MITTYPALCRQIEQSLQTDKPLILAIDGCCASGKTTLAGQLAARFDGEIVHMDDFFLPPFLRTPARLAEPGGNVHYERILTQIIAPLRTVKDAAADPRHILPQLSWERFDCSRSAFAPDLQQTQGSPFLILEGAYCMRPELRSVYDETLFLTIPPALQQQRILARNGAARWPDFRDKWIPMENRYFAHYEVAQACRLVMDNSGGFCE